MATDPITGLTLDQDRTQDVLDYLGRKSPVALSQQTALPGVQGASPSAGPASPGGSGLPTPGQQQQQQAGGAQIGNPFGQQGIPGASGGLAEAIGPPLISQLGGQLKNRGPGFFSTAPEQINPYPGSEEAGIMPPDPTGAALGLGPEEAGFTSGVIEDIPALGADLGATGLGSLLGPLGGWSAAYGLGKLGLQLGIGTSEGPTSGNPWIDAATGLLGPFGDPLAATIGELRGPSSAWRNFGSKLGGTLGGESSAISTLIPALGQAQTRGDVGQIADLFRQLIERGAGVGGYQLGSPLESGAPQLGVLPGAGGTPHEGGLLADFGPATKAINDYIGKLYGILPEGGPSAPLSYEAFAAGMPQAQYDQFQGLAGQLLGLPLEQQQAAVAASGLDPQRQDQLLRYVGNPMTYIERGLPIPPQFAGTDYSTPSLPESG